ncbi:hypothetical protein P0C27_19480 [Citrobacter freundii]|nr:hypothetical protein [Citrobacter freundii]MDE8796438.1 hypothetical protein [Citrobacter freundii]
MPNPKSYSRIAIAVSAALTSMVFSAHAAWIDVDSLPSSGLVREGANKRGNSSRLTQSFHFFMFEPIFSPVNALNQPI